MDFDEYPPELVRAVGLVVMSAAWAEDKAGELVQFSHQRSTGTWGPARGWAASGRQLVEAFEKVVGPVLAKRLQHFLDYRNEVVHGVFIRGEFVPLWDGEVNPEWVSMKRQMGKDDPASIASVPWTVDSLLELARDLSTLELEIDNEISYAMGLRTRPSEE
ncbi:hypothetical protein [Williamsia sterculiae]|uniref:Uncharacterized protein n=1 Tax=Williamsia sterculiae TaxID=1344003 RepID=A0A1N7FTQ3_9NOCA|nr:hypothetical protein [Williamsia sterculiae]SIS03729.1 hypothetical protein SAMN05445060_2278 [Williamsia sterculiae]